MKVKITEVRATLLAALIAAIAAVVGAVMSNSNAAKIASLTNQALEEQAEVSFHRSQIDRLVNMAFKSAIELHTRYYSCWNVVWIQATKEAEIIEDTNRQIETIRYAYGTLVKMQALPTKTVEETDQLLNSRIFDWTNLAGARFSYREHLEAGDITPDGGSNKVAKDVEKRYMDELHKVGEKLEKLHKKIAEIHAVSSIRGNQ